MRRIADEVTAFVQEESRSERQSIPGRPSAAGAGEQAVRTPAPVPKREPGLFRLTSLDRHTSPNHPYGTPRRRSAAKSLLRTMSVSLDVRLVGLQLSAKNSASYAAGLRSGPGDGEAVE